jgi:hypothetical protein
VFSAPPSSRSRRSAEATVQAERMGLRKKHGKYRTNEFVTAGIESV